MDRFRDFIAALPKAELHIHIEGSLEPEHLFALARKNNISIPYSSVDDVRRAYNFTNLQSFLDVYYLGTKVLVTKDDFAELAFRYLTRAHMDNVRHAEIMFDPQSHTARGVTFETVLAGLELGMARAKTAFNGLSSALIMSFLRHLSEEEAFATLEQAMPFLSRIHAVGLDSGEQGNPPEKFKRVFAKCAELGLRKVAHAGEEGPPSNIRDAISMLGVCRVDHGVACTKDAGLVEELVASRMPLTVCPRSNVCLRVFSDYAGANTVEMLRKGICVTINSDDPAYFGGYLNANYEVLAAVGVTVAELAQLAKNGFEASWLPTEVKQRMMASVDEVAAAFAN
jgi:adenosine deaminase